MSTLHEEFRGAINDGDERLRENLGQAVADLRDRMAQQGEAGESLSTARMERLDERITTLDEKLDARLVTARDYLDGILGEHRRALVVAEQEREKAARALRDELNRAITAGDEALGEHIRQQVAQVTAALANAEKLEVTRIDALKNAVTIASVASEAAIAKAEQAAEKRFEAVNAFRAQLADQVATFLPREVAEAQLKQVADRLSIVEANQLTSAGASAQRERSSDKTQPWVLWGAGAFVSLFIALIVIGVGAFT